MRSLLHLALPLLLLVACDAVKPELLDAELDSRDAEIEALQSRLMLLESTVTAQAATIEEQAQALAAERDARVADVAALGQSVADGNAALDARVSALDATVGVHDEILISHDAALTALSGRADATDEAVSVLDEDLGALQVDVALLGLGLSAAETRLTLLESADVAGIETRVSALEDARAAAGETWSWSPSGTTAFSGGWACAASGRASWHAVGGSVTFTPSADGAVAVSAQTSRYALEGASVGSVSGPLARLVIRDSSGVDVAEGTIASGRYLAESEDIVWGAQLTGGASYTASYEVSDDCSSLAVTVTSVGATLYRMTVITL